MRREGIEPSRLAPTDLKTVSLTTRTSSLKEQDPSDKTKRVLFDVAVRILQKVLPPRTTPPLPTILGSSILSPNSTKIEKRFEGSSYTSF